MHYNNFKQGEKAMATIEQIKLPDNTTYDIAAKYDINGNEIATTYLKIDEDNNVAVSGNITEGNQTLSEKYAAKVADDKTFGGVRVWNDGSILYIKTK